MRLTVYPNKALFDQRITKLREDPNVALQQLRNPVRGGLAGGVGVFDARSAALVEFIRWEDLA